MSKLFKILAVVTLVAGAIAITPGPALAQHHGYGGGHGGGWHGGYRGGWGPGLGFGLGWGYPYYYGGPYYYAPAPDCGWVRVRVWRGGHWVLRRVRRCW